MTSSTDDLQRALGYTFRDVRRLQAALTHPSYRYEREEIEVDNQRLEFLGDAILGFLTAAYLYRVYPDLREGELTKLRSKVNSSRPLADLAAECGLGKHLKFGRGERLSGGAERPSNLSDALEALVGAAYEDGGMAAVEAIFERLFAPYIDAVEKAELLDNPKGTLQELAQQRWKITPRYHVVSEEGPAHDRIFTVSVSLNNRVFATGQGSNKRDAQAQAAREAIPELERLDEPP